MIAGPADVWRRADRAAGGLALDLVLYLGSAVFAGLTAATSTLAPHRAWGQIAIWGYAVSALVVAGQLLARRPWLAVRAWLTSLTFVAVALVPLVVEAAQRSAGRVGRAQEEVLVVEDAGQRLLDTGTPYLGRAAIAGLPDPLPGYVPYQPGMALFGVPRAVFGDAWWTDARVWFALVTIAALAGAVAVLRPAGGPLLRAVQAATVLPLCALTLATGGDDLPVLALCLLALALAARDRFGTAGLAIGVAGALKLFAWPVAVVLAVLAVTRGRRPAGRFLAGAVGLPALAMLPAALVDPAALVENVLRYPLGRGLVQSPARSPLLGQLFATELPRGGTIAAIVLGAAGLALAVGLIRRPPRSASAAAHWCGLGLLAAILLMPSARFGYLLYPVAFLVWAPAFAATGPLGGVHLRHGRDIPGPRSGG